MMVRMKKPLAPKKPAPRADYGKPVDAFFAKQPAPLRPIIDTLRALIGDAAPAAESSIKWGMPFYSLGGKTVCAIGAHKAHVNLILPGAPGSFTDPDGLLEGEGKTGQHLKLRAGEAVPRAAIRGWLKTAVKNAKS